MSSEETLQQRSRKLHNEQVGVKRIKELPSGLYSKRNMDLLGRKKAVYALPLNTCSNTCTQGRKKWLTLSLRSVWLPSLEMSETVSEHGHYAWITYTPINDAHGILHTI